MIRFPRSSLINTSEALPDNQGVVFFLARDEILYVSKTSSIRRKFEIMKKRLERDKYLVKLFSLADQVGFEETESLFRALILEKKQLNATDPEFNHLIKDFNTFSYLEINFGSVPYFKVADTTESDRFYIGPFRSSFFIHDLLATMNLVGRFPLCQDSNYPCHLFGKGNCRGWCLKDKRDLIDMIKQNYLQENIALTDSLAGNKKGLEKELQFERADLINRQRRIIEKYYDRIKFLHITKQISGSFEVNGAGIDMEQGLLSGYTHPELKLDLPIMEISYNDNEYLAVDKSNLDEMWIIYNHLKSSQAEFFNKIYLKSLKRLFNLLAA